MKKNDKKEIKYLNVCMDKALHEEFEAFCKAHGMSIEECEIKKINHPFLFS